MKTLYESILKSVGAGGIQIKPEQIGHLYTSTTLHKWFDMRKMYKDAEAYKKEISTHAEAFVTLFLENFIIRGDYDNLTKKCVSQMDFAKRNSIMDRILKKMFSKYITSPNDFHFYLSESTNSNYNNIGILVKDRRYSSYPIFEIKKFS